MAHIKRKIKLSAILKGTIIICGFCVILPSVLIFTVVTESNRSLRGGDIRQYGGLSIEDDIHNWGYLFEKMKERKLALASNCHYLNQLHKKMFLSGNNNNEIHTLKHGNLISCDATGLTKQLICSYKKAELSSSLEQDYLQAEHKHNEKSSFLVVQHPFKRILSFFKTLSSEERVEIIRTMRLNTTELTFEVFIGYFIEYINQIKSHWLPIQKKCSVCKTQYDFILHMENIQEEKDYLLHKAGVKPPYSNLENIELLAPSDFQVKFYFSKLRKDLILKLYQIYRLDFELFGYTFNNYLKLGIPVPTTAKPNVRKT